MTERRSAAAVVVLVACAWSAIGAQQPTWRGLVIADEDRCSPYVVSEYRYPASVERLIVEGLGGRVYGPYTKRTFGSIRETDIEHIVARSEAHDSGLCASDLETKRLFARDLLNLTLAAPAVNRHQKSDRDAAEWLPAENRCWFAVRVIDVRRVYGLTIDLSESLMLEGVLASCTSTQLE